MSHHLVLIYVSFMALLSSKYTFTVAISRFLLYFPKKKKYHYIYINGISSGDDLLKDIQA